MEQACTKCGQAKPLEGFPKRKTGKNGRRKECQECFSSLYPKKPNSHRRGHLMRTFGLTLEAYDALLERQGYTCALCDHKHGDGGSLCVDHNHQTNEVRGLLCRNCNRALGYFGDSPGRLAKALSYLNDRGHYGST